MKLNFLPQRPSKPRQKGLTMIMDKGLTTVEAAGLCAMAEDSIDLVKFGFGTSLFSGNVKEKIAIYKEAGIDVYLGGTLLEAAYIRGQLADYTAFADRLGISTIEVSDGSIILDHAEKCALIATLSKRYRVISEVGSKVAGNEIPTDRWIEMMQSELAAGSWKVIAEAREAGNIGIYDCKGTANTEMIEQISAKISSDSIVWEAPQKAQQVWFVKHLGADVNLGNIAPAEVISLETIRCGLRGDTFALHLPDHLKTKVQ
ncbi:MAG: phosphosulfolactate synthase [Mucinivorans sp.]